jgi:hypothetical protein
VVLEVDVLAPAECDVDDRAQLALDAHGHVVRRFSLRRAIDGRRKVRRRG